MHFAHPQNLYLLLLLVPAVAAFVGYLWWKRRTARRIGDHALVRAMGAHHSNRRQVIRTLLVLTALALTCVAAAQPQWGEEEREIERFGVDVAFALDLSSSMLAEDIPPNRLDAAKDEISTSLETLSGDRAGLVVFTAISFAQSPLTGDSGAIRFYLDRLEPGQMPVGGTSVGQAIRDSVELLTGRSIDRDGRFEDGDDEPSSIDPADNQVIVLITDGEDHESSPRQAAKIARRHGIHVVTVGIGSPDGSRVPEYDEEGRLRGYKRDESGELVYSKLDEETLRHVAETTGGRYLRYDGPNSVAGGISDFIDELEESEFESMMRRRYKDRYMYFLAPAVLLLIAAGFLRERRDKKTESGGPLDATRSTMIVLMVLVALVGLTGCEDAFRTTVAEVARGNELIDEGDYEAALQQYERTDESIKTSPEVRYNRGIAHLGAGQHDQARETFARALETDDPQLYFDTMFNLGLALASQEEWKHAHRAYKEALGVDLDLDRPANRERVEQARHNLEVTLRKLYPPCEELEDDFEQNDRSDEATPLEEPEQEDLTLCGGDDDWYAIPAVEGTKIETEAIFEQLREEPDPEHRYLPDHQDLTLSLWDSRGKERLATDRGEKADETNDAERVTRRLDQIEVTDQMLSGDDDFILMKVEARAEREFSYDFELDIIPPCEQLDDDYEDNDSADQAARLDDEQTELHICPDDEDWFEVDLEPEETLFVDLMPAEDRDRERPPKLDMQIIEAETERVVSKSKSEKPFVTAGVQNVEDGGTYHIRVRGEDDDQQGPYRADLYRYEPCEDGNDRLEPNDRPARASQLQPGTQTQRYLRLCEGDRDYFRLPPSNPQGASGQAGASKDDQDRKVSWGLAAIADQSSEEQVDLDDTPPKLDLMTPGGERLLAKGQRVETLEASAKDTSDDDKDNASEGQKALEKLASGLDRLVRYDNEDDEQLVLRASGPQSFYHLTDADPRQQPSQNQQGEQDQQQDQDSQDQDQRRDDQQKQDGSSKGDEDQQRDNQEEKSSESGREDAEEENDEERGEEGRGDERDEEGKEERDEEAAAAGDEEERGEEEQREERAAQVGEKDEEPVDPEERRVRDILRSLEESDDNVQMNKALEDMPRRHIEKDW